MKKSIAIVLALFLLLSSNAFAATTSKLKDVDTADTTYEKIQWVISQGYMKPVLGMFYPKKLVNRGEFAYLLSRLTGEHTSLKNPTKPTFTDVPTTDQYYKYIETMKTSINSYKTASGSKLFKPKEYITREDAAMAVVKVLGYDTDQALLDGVESEISIEDIVLDSNLVTKANMKYIEIVVVNELMDFRMDATGQLYFDPKKTITRYDMAELIWNSMQKRSYLKEKYAEEETDNSSSDKQTNANTKTDTNVANSNTNDTNTNDTNTATTNTGDIGNDYPYSASSGDAEYPWSRDILVPFVNDPDLIGDWVSVNFVPTIDSFVPNSAPTISLFLTELNIKANGLTDKGWFKWTKGHILNVGGDRTNGNLVLKEINGEKYLFLQWICGDQLIRNMEPSWYVLKLKK